MSVAAQRAPLIAALEQLGPHDHFCSIYESPEEHYAVAVPFIRIGLDRDEKCIYIADDGTVGDVRQAMDAEGIDVDRAMHPKRRSLNERAGISGARILSPRLDVHFLEGSHGVGDERRLHCTPRYWRDRMGFARRPGP